MSTPTTPRTDGSLTDDSEQRARAGAGHVDRADRADRSDRGDRARDAPLADRTRRGFLAGAAVTAAGLAGCLDGDDEPAATSFRPDLPTVPEPPDVVYVPSHREAMAMVGAVEVGDYAVGAMVSYPHEFWTVTDGEAEPVAVEGSDDVHLMATVADAETGAAIPTDEGITLRLRKDGDLVRERSPWSMLSQGMGFHFGDNLALDGDGTYELEVALPPAGVRRTGAFADRFEDHETATLEFEFTQELRDSLIDGVEYVEEAHRGEPGALEPMDHGGMGSDDEMDHGGMDDGDEMEDDGTGDDGMGGSGQSDDGETNDTETDDGEMQDGGDTDDGMAHDAMDGDGMDGGHAGHGAASTTLPAPGELPGTLQHPADDVPRSHDADVAISVVDEFRGRSPYLLVSPRTPYNAYPLPETSPSATVVRDGDPVVEDAALVATIDPDAGFHYGREIAAIEPGDELTVAFGSAPSVARHQGYETAFLEMTPVEVALEGW